MANPSPSRPRLLDLFCGAGGAAMGYHRAGFEVVGVDNKPQPGYPFEFEQADALGYMDWFCGTAPTFGKPCCTGHGKFDAIHASPPCQFATDYKRTGNVKEAPNLIPATREVLRATGLPYVIENVPKAAAHLISPVLICGSQFDPVMEIRRHRPFEANWPLQPPAWPCRHKLQVGHRFPGGWSGVVYGDNRHPVRATVEIGAWDIPLAVQRRAMGIGWMSVKELSQAIPPAYTELIGVQLMQHVRDRAASRG